MIWVCIHRLQSDSIVCIVWHTLNVMTFIFSLILTWRCGENVNCTIRGNCAFIVSCIQFPVNWCNHPSAVQQCYRMMSLHSQSPVIWLRWPGLPNGGAQSTRSPPGWLCSLPVSLTTSQHHSAPSQLHSSLYNLILNITDREQRTED